MVGSLFFPQARMKQNARATPQNDTKAVVGWASNFGVSTIDT